MTQTQGLAGTDEQQRRAHELAVYRRLIGPRYADCTLNTFEATTDAQVSALARVQQFVRRCGYASGGLLLVGPPGTGKDHLAIGAAGAAIIRHGLSVNWVNGVEWYSRQRDRIDSGRSEREEIAKLLWADVLIISDPLPPDATLTGYQSQLLYQVLDHRYRHLRQTWATVNVLGPDDFRRRMTGPIADRLLHDATVVQCYWPSHRKPRREES